MKKAFITKHWEAHGIQELLGEVYIPDDSSSTTYWSVKTDGYGSLYRMVYRMGTDAFFTIKEANENVKKKAAAKLVSLNKKIAKISKWL